MAEPLIDGERVITVRKLSASGREVLSYPGRLLQEAPSRRTIEARFDFDDVQVEGLTMRRGDRFVETFYTDRWYNVFAIYDGGSGRLKGWYCNLTRPARFDEDAIHAEDLELDLLVLPDGRMSTLDAAEFDALPLTPSERRAAQRGLEDLLEHARNRSGPFASTG
jgi:hypothetical protein